MRHGWLELRDDAVAAQAVYGRPRIHAELRAQGERVGNKRVARLMKQAGIEGASRRRSVVAAR